MKKYTIINLTPIFPFQNRLTKHLIFQTRYYSPKRNNIIICHENGVKHGKKMLKRRQREPT